MVTFRTLTPEEMPTAVQLWVDVFGVEAPFFQTLLDGDPPGGVSVGAFEDGKLVSSVHVFIRWFRKERSRQSQLECQPAEPGGGKPGLPGGRTLPFHAALAPE